MEPFAEAFSFSRGASYVLVNSAALPKSCPGWRKSKRFQTSRRRISTGVPVEATRNPGARPFSACEIFVLGVVLLGLVGDDNRPMVLHLREGVLVVRNGFIVGEDDPILTQPLQIQHGLSDHGLLPRRALLPHVLQPRSMEGKPG